MIDPSLLLLGIAFTLAAKPIDLIDENKWIGGAIGFALKYGFVLLSGYVIFLSLAIDHNLTPHFLSLFLFWTLRGKFNYPSHVLFAFIPAMLIGHYLTTEYLVLGLAGLTTYGILEYLIRRFSGWFFQIFLYRSLARFLIVPSALSIYLDDLNILAQTFGGLLSTHVIRHLIRKDVIRIREGIRT